ncbi:MAG: peptidoglycan-binding domain-containing protein [Terriglobales bacterium]
MAGRLYTTTPTPGQAFMITAFALSLWMSLWLTPPHKKHVPTRHKPVVRATRKYEEAGISRERATQIQKALVQAGYLKTSSGSWDSGTAAALKKYQSDHRWQTRFVPDARALLALGLVAPVASTPAAEATLASNGGGN